MKAVCKIDYGQFEYNKSYNYSYLIENNNIKFYVVGQYGDSEFNRRQFEAIFENSIKNKK